MVDGSCQDLETLLLLGQIAKHSEGGPIIEKIVPMIQAGTIGRTTVKNHWEALKEGAQRELDLPVDEGAAAEAPPEAERAEVFGKLELAEGPARALLAALKFSQAKKPSSRPGDALIAHVQQFIDKTWPTTN